MNQPLLKIEGVHKRFTRKSGLVMQGIDRLTGRPSGSTVHALSDISLSVTEGEVLGLVGESGCGKSTLGRIISGIYTPSDGEVFLKGAPVARKRGNNVEKLTTKVQMIHQDPFASLNPRMKVGETIAEGPRIHGIVKANAVRARVRSLLQQVGLEAAYADRLPHQFSGGQRQRIAIARALAMEPELLVLDEAVASLDVSIQAQVLNLFMDLRRELGLTAIFISHDLSVVRHVCDRVAIMYLGRIVELASAEELYARPLHPYTKALFASIPKLGAGRGSFQPIEGRSLAAQPAEGLRLSSALSDGRTEMQNGAAAPETGGSRQRAGGMPPQRRRHRRDTENGGSMIEFSNRIAEINDILCAVNMLQWDARVMMPAGGAATRGQQIATLKAMARGLLLDGATEETAEAVLASNATERNRRAAEAVLSARKWHMSVPPELLKRQDENLDHRRACLGQGAGGRRFQPVPAAPFRNRDAGAANGRRHRL
nr:ATP-binding cassette domain-containing protein [Marinicella sp. W31]MDC2876213.1 ATP-binding cassette domain-containing protein [Marinicella sp. W31]